MSAQSRQRSPDYSSARPRSGDLMSERVGMLYDMTRCIGCQACTVACKQWFDQYPTFDEPGLRQELNAPHTNSDLPPSYQSLNDLTWQDYTMMRFYEVEHEEPVAVGSRVSWHFLKDACHHCGYAPCAAVCPVDAIGQMEKGQIVIDQEVCIGCGYCVNGCWANIPRLNPDTGKAYKCDFCYDRTSHGLEPMCSKACPTDCITYGFLEDLREIAERRVKECNRLNREGAHRAWVYDNRDDLDGLGVFYVLNAPIEVYEGPTVPRAAQVPDAIAAWHDLVKPLGWLSFWGMAGATFLHYVACGPKGLPEPEVVGPSRAIADHEEANGSSEAGSEHDTLDILEADRRAREQARFWNECIHRFSVLQRVLHWVMAAAGIVCILTGLGWYTDSFQFLLGWFGGGEWARWIHSVSGIVMAVSTVWLIGVIWFRRVFRFDADDWKWLKAGGGYLRRHSYSMNRRGSRAPELKKELPPQGFFNAGQKGWGILAIVLAIVFLGSGLVIWSPEIWNDFLGRQPFSVPVMRAMYVIHDVAFIIFAPMIVLHIYLSSMLDPGSFAGMSKGDVSRLWASHHHEKWYRQANGEEQESNN